MQFLSLSEQLTRISQCLFIYKLFSAHEDSFDLNKLEAEAEQEEAITSSGIICSKIFYDVAVFIGALLVISRILSLTI